VSQVVNRSTVVTWPAPTEPPGARNPAPGVCLPVIVNFCQQHRVSYNFTVFPNYIGHFGQRDAQQVSHFTSHLSVIIISVYNSNI
jgi:atrial natriuretic peptide-converting enzyme